jgi:hypothetical protein
MHEVHVLIVSFSGLHSCIVAKAEVRHAASTTLALEAVLGRYKTYISNTKFSKSFVTLTSYSQELRSVYFSEVLRLLIIERLVWHQALEPAVVVRIRGVMLQKSVMYHNFRENQSLATVLLHSMSLHLWDTLDTNILLFLIMLQAVVY